MNNYPDDLDDEALERLAKMFPDTANDLKLWKRCNEIGKMFAFLTKKKNRKIKKNTKIKR